MKRLFAILLLLVFLYHLIGYKFVFQFLENKANYLIENKINQLQYSNKDLIEFTIQLNMPYYSQSNDNSAYGEIEIKGIKYQFVKRSIVNNVLHLYCLPNTQKTKLVKLENSFEQINVESKQKKDFKYKIYAPNFFNAVAQNDFTNFNFEKSKKINVQQNDKSLFKPNTLEHPPSIA